MNLLSGVIRPRSRIAIVVWSAFFSFFVSACSKPAATPITIQAAGHDITAEIEGTPLIENLPTSAVITSPHGKVTIERERVRLDDLEWTAIPAEVPVTVSIKQRCATAGTTTMARTTSD